MERFTLIAMALFAASACSKHDESAGATPPSIGQPAAGESDPRAKPPSAVDAAAVVQAAADAGVPMTPGQRLLAAEMEAFRAAKPVLDEHCADCHTRGEGKPTKKRKEALKHFAMDSYPFGGHHAEELGATMRKVMGASGKRATMPKGDEGAVAGAELDLLVTWSKAFDAAKEAKVGHHGKHDGRGHHH